MSFGKVDIENWIFAAIVGNLSNSFTIADYTIMYLCFFMNSNGIKDK